MQLVASGSFGKAVLASVAFAFLCSFFALVALSPSALAYSSCSSGAACDYAGQDCQKNYANGCHNALSCNCVTTEKTIYWLEPFFKDCFCLSQLEINAFYDGTGTANDSRVGLVLSVSQDLKTFYEEKSKTTYSTQCNFDGGNAITCPPQRRDPPVDCRLYLTGPSVVNALVSTKTINADPGRTYADSMAIPASYLSESGQYTAMLDCGIRLPAGSIECVTSCSTEFRTFTFGIQQCSPVVSVGTDKSQYATEAQVLVSGTLSNENAPASGSVQVTVYDSNNNTVATANAVASNGAYSAPVSTSGLATGNYRVVATASVGSCPQASATSFFSFTKCATTLAASVPQTAQSGSPVVVSGTVFNDNSPVQAKVVIATKTNGLEVDRQEVFSNSSGGFAASLGPFLNGNYASEIIAEYDSCPQVSTSRGFSVQCALSSTIQSSSQSYLAGQAAAVNGTISNPASSYLIIVRDANGNIVAQRPGSTSNGFFSESFANLSQGDYTATLQASSGQCASQSQAFFKVGCDISASIAQLPKCFGNEAEIYAIRVDNLLSSNNTLQFSYSSPLQITGAAAISLNASESAVVNFSANPAEDFLGNTIAIVNVFGSNSACTQKLQVPICVRGKLSIEANPDSIPAISGTTSCFPVTLRNRGSDSAIVALSSVALSGTNYSGYFNTPQVRVSAYEIRDDLQYCVGVPSGAATGLNIYTLRAQSAINDAQDDATLSVINPASLFSSSTSGACTPISADSSIPISFTNNLAQGDYFLEFTDFDGLGIRANPSAMLNFANASSRTIYLSFSPVQPESSRARYATLAVKKDGADILSQSLCFYSANGTSSQITSSSTTSSLSPQSIAASCTSPSTSTLRVKNNAGATASYSLSAQTSAFDVAFSPSTLSLSPNAEATVVVSVSPKSGATSGAYSIPITMQYSSTQSGTQARIECGNGNTVAASGCSGTSGVCTATCSYSYDGAFTATGNLRGVQCASTRVAVGSAQQSCIISASPNSVATGSSSTITVDYRNLGYTPSSITINCGNGNTAYASGCSGTTGSCTASCNYPNSGIYSLSSTASGVSCQSTQIAVGTSTPWCTLFPTSPYINSASSSSISAYYANVPETTSTTTNSYSSSETLSVSLPSTCTSSNFAGSLSYAGGSAIQASGNAASTSPNLSQANASNTLPVGLSLASAQYSLSLDGTLNATLEFSISNPANFSEFFATAQVTGLPSNWTANISQPSSSIKPGQNATATVKIGALQYDEKDHNATLEVRDSSGKIASLPFTIKASDATGMNSIMSGFFVAGSSETSLLLFAIIVLLFSGGILVMKAKENFEKAREQQK